MLWVALLSYADALLLRCTAGTFATFLDTDGYIMRWQRFSACPAGCDCASGSAFGCQLQLTRATPRACASDPVHNCGIHFAYLNLARTLPRSIAVLSLGADAPRSNRFFSSRGSLCCQELRGLIDLGAGQTCGQPYAPPLDYASGCPPVGPCLGFLGACADLQEQFIGLQGCYTYGDPGAEAEHPLLDDYVCHQFPDDAYVTDQFFVALISVAVALPVDWVLARAFEIANEVDGMPEAWLDAPPGKWQLVLGKEPHNKWRLADPAVPIKDLTLWFLRYSEESTLSSIFRLLSWLFLRRCGRKAPQAEQEAPAPEDDAGSEPRASSSGASADARADALQ